MQESKKKRKKEEQGIKMKGELESLREDVLSTLHSYKTTIKESQAALKNMCENEFKKMEKSIEALNTFKGQTVIHQVELKKQLGDLRDGANDMNVKLEESTTSLQRLHERIERMEEKIEEHQNKAKFTLIDDCIKNLQEKVHDLENASALSKVQTESVKNDVLALQTSQKQMPFTKLQLRERKMNNVILFGIPEDNAQNDGLNIQSLLHDLEVNLDLTGTHFFRVGRINPGKCRPIVLHCCLTEDLSQE